MHIICNVSARLCRESTYPLHLPHPHHCHQTLLLLVPVLVLYGRCLGHEAVWVLECRIIRLQHRIATTSIIRLQQVTTTRHRISTLRRLPAWQFDDDAHMTRSMSD